MLNEAHNTKPIQLQATGPSGHWPWVVLATWHACWTCQRTDTHCSMTRVQPLAHCFLLSSSGSSHSRIGCNKDHCGTGRPMLAPARHGLMRRQSATRLRRWDFGAATCRQQCQWSATAPPANVQPISRSQYFDLLQRSSRIHCMCLGP